MDHRSGSFEGPAASSAAWSRTRFARFSAAGRLSASVPVSALMLPDQGRLRQRALLGQLPVSARRPASMRLDRGSAAGRA
jgi:hypothetical protein